tara:strand:- start:1332 stop:2246 length:915 start_codon:yes stop_codon:yes gene_type:complete
MEKIPKKLMLKCVIIGLGKIGAGYDLSNKKIVSHYKAIKKNPNIKLIGVIEKNKKKFIKIKDKKVKFFPNIKKASKEISPDLIIISVPTKIHLKIFKECTQNFKSKYFVMEKPGGSNFKEFCEIKKIIHKKNLKVVFNYMRLYDVSTNTIRNKLSNKKKFNASVVYNSDLSNNGSHFISLMLFIFGRPFKINNVKKISNIDYNFILYYKNGKIYFSSLKNKKMKGSFEIKFENNLLNYLNNGSQISLKIKEKKYLKIRNNFEFLQKFFYINFIKNYKKKNYFNHSLKLAYSTQKIINTIKRSKS